MISTVESYSPEQMQARCAREQCTVAALASHIAGVHLLGVDWIQRSRAGGPMPKITMDDVKAINAERSARDAERATAEILNDLRSNGADASRAIKAFSDQDLGRSTHFMLIGQDITTDGVVGYILIGDIEGHLESIKQAGGQPAVA